MPVLKDERNGVVTGYKVYYVKNEPDLTEDDAEVVTVNPDARGLTLGQLSIWTEYKIWVSAFTTTGDGPKSQPIIVSTDEDGR